MSLGERVFRVLLLAYPPDFRRRYREDLVAFFLADRSRPRYANGVGGGFAFWRKTCFDLARAATATRFSAAVEILRRGSNPTIEPNYHSRQKASSMSAIVQDLRYAGRMFIRNPGFTIVALATLTLGIGVNATMFGVVNGVLLEDLPFFEAERVVAITGGDTDGEFGVSENERLWYRQETGVFESFGTFDFAWINLTGPDGAERVVGARIDEGVLPALGVAPFIGRGITAAETRPGNNTGVLLSHGLWQSRYAGAPDVLGKTIALSGLERTIVGVLPANFRLPGDFVGQPVQLYLTRAFGDPDPRNIHYMNAVARLAPGVSVEQLRAHMSALAPSIKEALPTLPPTFEPIVTPVPDLILGEIRPILFILLAAVGLLLLIACVNVANIFLARSESRSGELALRIALGASRGRIVRQLMSESVVLALLGGLLGLAFAKVATDALVRFNPPNVPRIDQLTVDLGVVGFVIAVSLVTALFFGIVPALANSRLDLRATLHEGGRSATTGRGRNRLRRSLVVVQVALAMVLATGAGLLVRSFVLLQGVEPGLTTDRVLTMQTTLPFARYNNKDDARAFYATLLDQVRALPGVLSAGAISALPLASDPGDWGIRIEGREEERLPSGRRLWADRIIVTDDYFESLDIRLVEGRTFTRSDIPGANEVVVINETTAKRYWPGESAIGKRFRLSTDMDGVYRTVIGVTRDVKHLGLSTEVKPEMYLPYAQHPAQSTSPIQTMNLVVRTATEPEALVAAVRSNVRAIDPDVPLSNVRTMDDVLAASTSTERLNVSLFSVFGVLGLLLVSVGVYGVMSYLVSKRTKELGIRMALGAAPTSVVKMVVRNGLILAITGSAIGALGALTLGRLLSNLLFGVTWYDPWTFLAVPVLVTTVALLACAYPALRATRVDPMRVLRTD